MSDCTSTADSTRMGLRPRGSLAVNAFYLLLGQVISTSLSVVLTAALGRKLGAAEFGEYFVLVSMSTFAFVFVEWGQNTYLIREAVRRPADAETLLGSALAFRVAAALAAALATGVGARLLRYDAPTQGLAILTVLFALPLSLSQPYGYLFRGRDRMDLDAAVVVTAKVLTVTATVIALHLGGRIASVITVQAVGGFGALAVAVVLARGIGIPSPRPRWETARELATGGGAIAVFFVAMSVQPYLDAIILSKLAPASAVGWYGAARNIMGVLFAPAAILAQAAFPELSRTASSAPDLRRAIRCALRPIVALGALGAVGTYLFADFAVSLIYGRGRFDPAAAVLEIFAPALLLFFVDILLGMTITAVGRTRELAIAKLLTVVASAAIALALVPFFQARYGNGGMGIVVGFGSTEVVMLVACVALAPRGAFDLRMLTDLLRAVLAAGATLVVMKTVSFPSPWTAIPVCISVFAALAFALGLLRTEDVSSLTARFRRG